MYDDENSRHSAFEASISCKSSINPLPGNLLFPSLEKGGGGGGGLLERVA